MRPSTILIWSCVVIGAIAMYRGAKCAEHPARTAEHGPGWQLHRALPGEEYRPVGPFFDTRGGCLVDLASDRFAMPSGTRLACVRIDTNATVRR